MENEETQIPVNIARKFKPEIKRRRVPRRSAAADRFRPHRRADRQAGHRPAGARSRAQRQFDEFKDRVGEIINGVVKRSSTAT